ncbi:MAG: alpha-E domain-containing protein [Planctomycetota bacterium]
MLSRVADSIYWMSRYVERAENVARFVSVNLHLSLDLPGEAGEQWWPLVVTTGDDQQYLKENRGYHRDDVIHFLTLERSNPNSIASCLSAARENARQIREIISTEMYEHLNHFHLMVKNCRGLDDILDDPHTFFNAITSFGQQFIGVTDATMTHGEAWHFSRLGHMIERADKTSRILDVKYFILLPTPHDVGTPYDDVQWLALLRSASALAMYRQRHGQISPTQVVEFLVLDPEFPRAVLHCLTKANESLHAISGTPPGSFSNLPEQRLGQLRAELAYTRAEEIISKGLHEFIDHLQAQLNLVGDCVSESFFALRTMASAR